MRALRRCVAWTVMLVLLGGLSAVALAQPESDDAVGVTESLAPTRSPEFPSGTFVGESDDWVREFSEDGTGRAWEPSSYRPESHHNEWTFEVEGDLYEQVTFNLLGEPLDERPPWTYRWQFDGEYLTFEAVSEDPDPHRQQVYEQPHRYVPEARTAVVARSDIEAGEKLWMGNTELRVVPGADVPVDTLTDLDPAALATATMAVTKGQPITPDMLEPPAE